MGYGAITAKKKRTIFDPQAPPYRLWTMPLKKRLINVAGALSPGVLGPGTGEDALTAIAAGAQPGFPLHDLEYRATILGALAVLKAVGIKPYSTRNFALLKANVVGSDKLNAQIVAAAGLRGRKLKVAALTMQRVVAKKGKALATAAWGMRGLAIMANLKAFQIARAGATIGVQFVPVVGQIVGAAVAAHGSISAVIAKAEIAKLNGYVKSGIAAYRSAELKNAAKAGESATSASKTAVAASISPAPTATTPTTILPWIVGGVALLAVVAFFATRKRTTPTRAIA